jgi:hypothetical protein
MFLSFGLEISPVSGVIDERGRLETSSMADRLGIMSLSLNSGMSEVR